MRPLKNRLKTTHILLEKPFKNHRKKWAVFERCFKEDLSGVLRKIWAVENRSNLAEKPLKPLISWVVLSGISTREPTKGPGKVMWPRIDLHKRNMLFWISPHRKSSSYNCLHQMYGKMLIIQLSYNFKKPLKKDSIKFLRLFEPITTVWCWKITTFN